MFQVAGATTAGLRWEPAFHAHRAARGPVWLEWSEQGRGEEIRSDRELDCLHIAFIPRGMGNLSTPHEGLCLGFKSTP